MTAMCRYFAINFVHLACNRLYARLMKKKQYLELPYVLDYLSHVMLLLLTYIREFEHHVTQAV